MDLVGGMIERGEIEYGLVVDGESSREVQSATIERLKSDAVTVDQFRSEFATLTLGSGGVAMLLGKRTPDTEHRYLGGVMVAATEWSGLCRGQKEFMQTDTKTLLAKKGSSCEENPTVLRKTHSGGLTMLSTN